MSTQGIGSQQWSNLVSETQLAADLVLTGIRRISRLPMDGPLSALSRMTKRFPYMRGCTPTQAG